MVQAHKKLLTCSGEFYLHKQCKACMKWRYNTETQQGKIEQHSPEPRLFYYPQRKHNTALRKRSALPVMKKEYQKSWSHYLLKIPHIIFVQFILPIKILRRLVIKLTSA